MVRWKNTWLPKDELGNARKLLAGVQGKRPSTAWTQTGQTGSHRRSSLMVRYFDVGFTFVTRRYKDRLVLPESGATLDSRATAP